MITYREYCKNLKEDWGKTSPIPKETYKPVDWKDNFKWVDLGLPSGTLWADGNIPNPDDGDALWTYGVIMKSQYKDFVPTFIQADELLENCKWDWDDGRKGVVVTGRNGNSIFLPAEGDGIGNAVANAGEYGGYWTSKFLNSYSAFYFYFTNVNSPLTKDISHYRRSHRRSVRLARRPEKK